MTCGWLFRQLHAWGATLMVLFVTLHMTRTFFMGAFKKPRELTWVVGVSDRDGHDYVRLQRVPAALEPAFLLGHNRRDRNRRGRSRHRPGGPDRHAGRASVGGETLSRFFTVHVVVLPWVLAFLMGCTCCSSGSQNLATMDPVGEEKPYPPSAGIPFWPVHMAKEGP